MPFSCFLCAETERIDDRFIWHTFTDVGPQIVHESCYEQARDAWEAAWRGEEEEDGER